MGLEHQEILVKVIVLSAVIYMVWKKAKRSILQFASRAFLKSGNVKMAMKLRPKKSASACMSDCSCPTTQK